MDDKLKGLTDFFANGSALHLNPLARDPFAKTYLSGPENV